MPSRLVCFVQIDVELTTRDDLVKQKAELETKARQQSQEQSDIYQYLRNKLKDNYVAIAELENQVWSLRLVATTSISSTQRFMSLTRARASPRMLDSDLVPVPGGQIARDLAASHSAYSRRTPVARSVCCMTTLVLNSVAQSTQTDLPIAYLTRKKQCP